jgi:polyisoprenoid-binding protein YceI
MPMKSLALAAILFLNAPIQASATPTRYVLDAAASNVAFEVDFGQDRIQGRMPVAFADIALDFDRPGASTISVALDVAHARTNLPFATGAMKGDSVLDAQDHPVITFVSTALAANGANSADVDGILTVRGVARPVKLRAEIFRPEGRDPGDRSALAVQLSTRISRAAFGASGYPDMVGDEVRIRILARIDMAN